jgi:hypothetical protein
VKSRRPVPQFTAQVWSCLDGILPPWKVSLLLTLLERLERIFMLRPKVSVDVGEKAIKIKDYLGESPPDGTSLLRSEVERKVLLVFVKLPSILACLLVGHGEHPGDRLAHGVTTHR